MGTNSLTIGWNESEEEKADDAQCSSTKTARVIQLVSQTPILVSASRIVLVHHMCTVYMLVPVLW